MSRGTAKTMIEAIAAGTRLRRNGRIVTRDWAEEGSCDFGQGEKPTTQVSWGDVATAFRSTGIPNIEVYFDAWPAIRAFARRPWFVKSLPGSAAASRTPGAAGELSQAEWGYLHCGPNGAGHFVKMVHNGIEYGIMAAYAEGFNVLRHANVGLKKGEIDAETTPLRHPDLYRYDIDVAQVAEVWRRGSVISSWLLDLTASALRQDSDLNKFTGRVSDSGEGRWTLEAAIDEGVPAPVLSAALFQRFGSRGATEYADKLMSAMRLEFGGHHEKPAGV
jgi:6-phosphogluconate dehydrogenase